MVWAVVMKMGARGQRLPAGAVRAWIEGCFLILISILILSYPDTFSFSSLPTLKKGSFLALTEIDSPVLGFLPV